MPDSSSPIVIGKITSLSGHVLIHADGGKGAVRVAHVGEQILSTDVIDAHQGNYTIDHVNKGGIFVQNEDLTLPYMPILTEKLHTLPLSTEYQQPGLNADTNPNQVLENTNQPLPVTIEQTTSGGTFIDLQTASAEIENLSLVNGVLGIDNSPVGSNLIGDIDMDPSVKAHLQMTRSGELLTPENNTALTGITFNPETPNVSTPTLFFTPAHTVPIYPLPPVVTEHFNSIVTTQSPSEFSITSSGVSFVNCISAIEQAASNEYSTNTPPPDSYTGPSPNSMSESVSLPIKIETILASNIITQIYVQLPVIAAEVAIGNAQGYYVSITSGSGWQLVTLSNGYLAAEWNAPSGAAINSIDQTLQLQVSLPLLNHIAIAATTDPNLANSAVTVNYMTIDQQELALLSGVVEHDSTTSYVLPNIFQSLISDSHNYLNLNQNSTVAPMGTAEGVIFETAVHGAALTGGINDDVLIAQGGGSIINGGSGNDIISASGGGNTITDIGTGHNIIYASGGSNKVTVGDGDNWISVGGSGGVNDITIGTGTDKVLASNSTIHVGNYDTITVAANGVIDVHNSSNSNLTTIAGDGDVIDTSHSNITVDSSDTYSFTFSGSNNTVIGNNNTNIIDYGTNNTITGIGANITVGNKDIIIGSGDNHIIVHDGYTITDNATGDFISGNNVFLTIGGNNDIITGSNNTITIEGNDALTINVAGSNNTIYGSTGNYEMPSSYSLIASVVPDLNFLNPNASSNTQPDGLGSLIRYTHNGNSATFTTYSGNEVAEYIDPSTYGNGVITTYSGQTFHYNNVTLSSYINSDVPSIYWGSINSASFTPTGTVNYTTSSSFSESSGNGYYLNFDGTSLYINMSGPHYVVDNVPVGYSVNSTLEGTTTYNNFDTINVNTIDSTIIYGGANGNIINLDATSHNQDTIVYTGNPAGTTVSLGVFDIITNFGINASGQSDKIDLSQLFDNLQMQDNTTFSDTTRTNMINLVAVETGTNTTPDSTGIFVQDGTHQYEVAIVQGTVAYNASNSAAILSHILVDHDSLASAYTTGTHFA